MLAAATMPLLVTGWTTLVTPSDPQRLAALLDGTAAAPTTPSSTLGGLSYVLNASDLTAGITYAVDDRVCARDSPQFVSFVDRLPGPPPSCAQVRLWVGRSLSVWWDGVDEVGAPVDVTDECRAAYGSVVTSTCSSEGGGPAMVFVTLEAQDGGHAAQPQPPRAHERVVSKSLRADYFHSHPHPRRRDDDVLVVARENANVLATAWVYAAPSTHWQTLAGTRPRLANGTPQPVLATTGCIVALSTRDHLWCTGMEDEGFEDVDAAVCAAIEETPGCLQPMAVLVHEAGHCFSKDHPGSDDNFAVTPEDASLAWSNVQAHPQRVDAAMHAFIATARPPWPSADDLEGAAVVFGASRRARVVTCANYTRDHTADDDDDDDDNFYDDDDDDDGVDIIANDLWGWLFWTSILVLLVCPLGLYWSMPVRDYSVYRGGDEGRAMQRLDEETAEGAATKSGRE